MKSARIGFLLAACSALFGCATGALQENMVYQGGAKEFDPSLHNSVEVTAVSGGQKTNPAWTSEISNEAFSGAVKSSLSEQGLLAEDGKYKLQAKLLKVDQPIFGLDFTVTTHVQYILTDSSTNQVLLDEVVIAPHTATVGDAFVAVKRLRLANEGSGKKNIEGLLEKLAELKIAPNEISLSQ